MYLLMHARRTLERILKSRHGAVLLFLCLYMGASLVTRVALLAKAAFGGQISWDLSLVGAFAAGFVYDLASAAWWALPLVLVLAILPRRFFEWKWARRLAQLAFFGAIYALLFASVAEWVFWDEFGTRFNFIAVDYLVYTHEVVGNIRESYNMPAILGSLVLGALVAWLLANRAGATRRYFENAAEPAARRWKSAFAWVAFCVTLGLVVSENQLPNFANNYSRELAKNGAWSLFAAFRANRLDYQHFYPTMSEADAFARVKNILARDGSEPLADNPRDLLRWVKNPGPEQHPNIIQITVESLSAEFLSRFGNTQNLTPNLDALVEKSLVFDNFYATGTRTDRGMEALTLSVPPTPGRSLVKRPGNENLFTLGSVLRSRGYQTAFIYGGYGYFDNMNFFFGENGYRVVDRAGVASTDITFANIWGACDEDLFRWTLREADRDHAAEKPFFHFVMTTSNHRPYTFPEGRIDLPSKTSGRSGGVKYTDHAIGEFLRAASEKPWFKNTIFIIVADHCASSAGKTEIPVQKYHIPLIIHAPGGQIKPGAVKMLASQIDYAPTLLGLLGWSYASRFYGWNVCAATDAKTHPDALGRALVGNYQKLGYFQGNQLGVLKPVRQSLTLAYDPADNGLTPKYPNAALINDAIATYQTACWLFAHSGQRALTPAELVRINFVRESDASDTVVRIPSPLHGRSAASPPASIEQ